MSYVGQFFVVGVVGMSRACAQRTINIFLKHGALIGTLAAHLMNQIVGSGFSLTPLNDYKYSTHGNPISRRRLSADRKNNGTLKDVGVIEPAFPKFVFVRVVSHTSSSTTPKRSLPDP